MAKILQSPNRICKLLALTQIKRLTLVRFKLILNKVRSQYKKKYWKQPMQTKCSQATTISLQKKIASKSYEETPPKNCSSKSSRMSLRRHPTQNKTYAQSAQVNRSHLYSLRGVSTRFISSVSACGSSKDFKTLLVRCARLKFVIDRENIICF